MANSIALAKKYLPMLDGAYKASSKTAFLDAPAEWVRETANANEVLIPKITVEGLGDYSRASGYVTGDATFAWQTHTFSQDRGRKFVIDAQDDAETLDVAFGATSGEFIRTRVAPEVDAYRFAQMFANAGTTVSADLTSSTAMQAIDTGIEALLNAEVDLMDIVIFISPKVFTFLKQSDLISRQFVVNAGPAVINREVDTLDGHPVIVVPQSRFYSVIDLYDGSTAGQEDGGFIKNVATGKDLNFVILDPSAMLNITKVALPRIFDPQTYQDANAWALDYRLYHDAFVLDNKVDGIYAHTVA